MDLPTSQSTSDLTIPAGPTEFVEATSSPEQETLWQQLADVFSAEARECEARFSNLDPDQQSYLASIELASAIGRLGKKLSLTPEQTSDIAVFVRHAFVYNIKPEDIAKTITASTDPNVAKMRALYNDPDFRKILRDESPLVADVATVSAPAPAGILTRPEPTVVRIKPTAIPNVPKGPAPNVVSGKEIDEPMPFILHEEQPADTIPESTTLRPSITFAPPGQAARPVPRPADPSRAKVQLPSEPRVVHYSDMRTPL